MCESVDDDLHFTSCSSSSSSFLLMVDCSLHSDKEKYMFLVELAEKARTRDRTFVPGQAGKKSIKLQNKEWQFIRDHLGPQHFQLFALNPYSESE